MEKVSVTFDMITIKEKVIFSVNLVGDTFDNVIERVKEYGLTYRVTQSKVIQV